MTKDKYTIFVINPGSSSTKIALFIGEEKKFQLDVEHNLSELKKCKNIQEQFPIRLKTIRDAIREHLIDLSHVDAFATRAGGLVGVKGGIYAIEEGDVLYETTSKSNRHPNVLGPKIAVALAKEYGGNVLR